MMTCRLSPTGFGPSRHFGATQSVMVGRSVTHSVDRHRRTCLQSVDVNTHYDSRTPCTIFSCIPSQTPNVGVLNHRW
ncbi:unnamed protein product [Mycena citricolor]|uniref:Uncharacterized protein n=1 Tax=Mycena citricolor TaxID=2018698 RepID=A0AAD2K2E6_9AGAR|nr:unnamed protein product [Mycena citricolor]